MVVSYFIARGIHVPIRKLVSASKEVAEGNLDTKVIVRTNDELQYLAISFNRMSEALKKRDEQLKAFTTQRIIKSERLALVGQLAANVAHELNSPLQGIVTFSHLMIEDDICDNPNHITSLEKIVVQANRCRDIIRGLLDFSRQREPDKALYNVNSVIGSCIALVEHQALFHNIQIVKNFQENLPLAILDASQIERVFINIIMNAAEAMEGNGKLSLDTRFDEEKQSIEIIFSDTGPGINEEHLKIIFDPFFTTKDVGHGTGLGLAISYGIVKGHKGKLSVESEVGKGTAFLISLPIEANGENGVENNG